MARTPAFWLSFSSTRWHSSMWCTHPWFWPFTKFLVGSPSNTKWFTLSGVFTSWMVVITSSTTACSARKIRMESMSQSASIIPGITSVPQCTSNFNDTVTIILPHSDHIRSYGDGITCHGVHSKSFHVSGQFLSHLSGTIAWMCALMQFETGRRARKATQLAGPTLTASWRSMTNGSRRSSGSGFLY